MVQDREYTGFQNNTTRLCERGPTLLETRRKRRKAEEVFIQQCKENIAKGTIDEDIPDDQEEIFIPNKRARYRVPKTFSSANPTQKKQSKPNVQKTNNNPNKATKNKSEQKKQKDNSKDEDRDIEQMSRVLHAKEEAKLNAKPLEIVCINWNITKCSGCDFRYEEKE